MLLIQKTLMPHLVDTPATSPARAAKAMTATTRNIRATNWGRVVATPTIRATARVHHRAANVHRRT